MPNKAPTPMMPLPAGELCRKIVMANSEIDKLETLWGMGDFDRGIQNIAMALAACREKLQQAEARAEAAEQKLAKSLDAHHKNLWDCGKARDADKGHRCDSTVRVDAVAQRSWVAIDAAKEGA